jgi:MarR family transcriptional regulator, organic hydroperoxide resistance regulator
MHVKSILIADIIDNLRRVFQVVNEHSKRVKRETSLTGPQLWTIKVIANEPNIRVSDLASKMYLHPATVVGILNRLETRGLIERIRTAVDRRTVNVALTKKGKEIVRKSPEVAQGLLVNGLEKFTMIKLTEINHALTHLVEILGAQEIPPKLLLSPEVNIPKKIIKEKKKNLLNKK